ncbi:hypothetical protein BV392_07700 [Rhodovulum sulfidophilum]|nr:hypothetical protein BV392_07700 [Rhodovulum sulfidophilum]
MPDWELKHSQIVGLQMSRQPRRHFTAEFKEQAVARLSELCASQTSIAREFGVTPSQLKGWRLELAASMSRKGDCLDNAPMESFFGSLKNELVHRTRFRSRREAKAALFECIAIFYNRKRRHSSIGDPTPEQARIDMAAAMAA